MKTRWIAFVTSSLVLAMPAIASPAQTTPTSLTPVFPALEGVQLTPEQQAQLAEISGQALIEVQSLLSPEQIEQLNTALTQGQSLRVALSSLNLSGAQQHALREEFQSLRSQLAEVLTPEQQQQIMHNARSLRQAY
jgi:Spy/CpxP family protein refolding chaperone